MKKLLLFLIVMLILVTPVSANRRVKTEQVERAKYTVMLDGICDVEHFNVEDIFPEIILPGNILEDEEARLHSIYLSEIMVQMLMIIDEDGTNVDRFVSVGVFLPEESVSESFGSLKKGEVQSIYPKLVFIAPLEIVNLDYYVASGLYVDIDYPIYCTFNIEYYWEFSWVVSLKPVTTATGEDSNLMMIVTFGVGGAFAILVICFVEWDNRRRSKRIKEKT